MIQVVFVAKGRPQNCKLFLEHSTGVVNRNIVKTSKFISLLPFFQRLAKERILDISPADVIGPASVHRIFGREANTPVMSDSD